MLVRCLNGEAGLIVGRVSARMNLTSDISYDL